MKEHLDRLYEIFNAGDWSKEDLAAYEAVTAFVRSSDSKDEADDLQRCESLCDDVIDELPVDSNEVTEEQGQKVVELLVKHAAHARAEGYQQALEQGVLERAFLAGVDE